MSHVTFILLARAIHVMAGVVWAGAALVLAIVVVPLTTRHATEGAGKSIGLAARRTGVLSGISALLTVLSGIYLFLELHPQGGSASEAVLEAGAAAALLSLAIGVLVGRTIGVKVEKLNAAVAQDVEVSPETARQLAILRARGSLTSKIVAGLLCIAVLAMSVFRYASAIS